MLSSILHNEQDRADWTTARDQFFIELLIEQAAKGKKTDVGFVKEAWKSVCLSFNRKFNLNYTIIQLKSRYKKLKTQYGMVKTLKSQNGFGWDDAVKVIFADEDVWERYIAAHPIARNYKNKCFPLYDQCAVLFDDNKADGRISVSSIRKGLMQGDVTAAVHTGTPTSNDTRSNDMNGNEEEDEASYEDPLEIPEPRHHREYSSIRREKRVRSSLGHRIATALENISSEFSLDCRSTQKPVSEDDVSFRRCMIELQSMQGLDPDDCVKAVTILKDPLNRVAFVTLSDDLRRRWLCNELDQLK
ncbi:unnamed protein product [Victoria cruziana]